MRKLYIFTTGNGGDGIYYAMSDSGYCFASHYCSGIGFAEGDLITNRPERKEMYEKHFGGERDKAFEVLVLEPPESPPEEVLALHEKGWIRA